MRLIDADALGNRMYHESFEKDSDLQRWDSGCWIRYKLFEQVLREMPTIDQQPTHETPSNTLDINVCVDKQAVKDALKKHFKKNPTMAIRAMAVVDEVPSVHTGFLDWQKIILTNLMTRKGKWRIDNPHSDDSLIYRYACSECHAHHRARYDFCPSCGADMRPQFEEPEINPCRGCEDYDGKGGCKSKGGCAGARGDSDE